MNVRKKMKTRNENNCKNGKDILLQIDLFRTFGPIYAVHFPAARSRVGIRLAANRNAKPNANTRTLRPHKCLVVKSVDSSLRPVCPSQDGIHRHHRQEADATGKAAFRVSFMAVRCRGRRKIRLCFYSLSAAARGGNLSFLSPGLQSLINNGS
jgi:hypothetical protein